MKANNYLNRFGREDSHDSNLFHSLNFSRDSEYGHVRFGRSLEFDPGYAREVGPTDFPLPEKRNDKTKFSLGLILRGKQKK